MAMGRWERQQEFWIATEEVSQTPRHVFYERVNQLLAKSEFDAWLEPLCLPYYDEQGRKSIPPGPFFRMLMVGYFEDIGSQRGIAWRCSDSLSLKSFLGCLAHAATPEHSSLTRITERLPLEVYREAFAFVLKLVPEHGLLKGQTLGVDSTTLESNAARKSIVRKDTGDRLAGSLEDAGGGGRDRDCFAYRRGSLRQTACEERPEDLFERRLAIAV